MKALKILNTIALTIPLIFALLGVIDESYLFTAVISTMATGFIQVLTGIFFWVEFPKSITIKIYFFLVATFFLLLFSGIGVDWIWFLPPILCLYLSILVYSLKNMS